MPLLSRLVLGPVVGSLVVGSLVVDGRIARGTTDCDLQFSFGVRGVFASILLRLTAPRAHP